ncbi:MAG: winged-helix domain-containing protein [Coriobacteriia bacterium]|nr:winged-helix domain-containing protein [Coriobacteriia bacterium]
MTDIQRAPDASVYRLSLYHCYLGELIRTGADAKITSPRIAEALNIKEETVRRDLSFVGGVGRPGSGYDVQTLFSALQNYLGLRDEYPILKVGTAQMLESLSVVFPAHTYGVDPVAYYSELPTDVGSRVHGIEVKQLSEIPKLDPELGITVALVACSPGFVQITLELLHQAGITGVLLLTPALRLNRPEGMTITHVRMPCDIKSLACRCYVPAMAEA